MTLIKSISGIRGTIGGSPNDGLTPLDIVKFSSAYAQWLIDRNKAGRLKVVLGRDARKSGEMVEKIVSGTLQGMGIDVISLGLATTPTVEIAVVREQADGGIIITASHNPGQWNALKLLNEKGEFLSAADGGKIISHTQSDNYAYVSVDDLGKQSSLPKYENIHIQEVLALEFVNTENIKKAGFTVAIDCVNSVGGIAIPALLEALGVKTIYKLFCEPDGNFPHNPEPLPENLHDIAQLVKEKKADVGFVVDPDVDRLAIVSEDGTMFGEEYTLVAVADYVLSKTPGNTASNLSSSRALKDITQNYGQNYFSSAVGEVNVVKTMKDNSCVIGGEGNGGVIYPASHYGRDALVGIALFLSLLAEKKLSCSALRKSYPSYIISKNKLNLDEGVNIDELLASVKSHFKNEKIDERDGIKIDFEEGWVHLRRSNTEAIIRIYAEAPDLERAEGLAQKVIGLLKGKMNK
ncbi:MAG: phosphoglucosamine mutase [Bacteroidales bacterium]|nr:phosphoglucosamine mutase [Bacteroidales bacterium]